MCVVVRREKEMILKKNMVSSVYLIIQKGALYYNVSQMKVNLACVGPRK